MDKLDKMSKRWLRLSRANAKKIAACCLGAAMVFYSGCNKGDGILVPGTKQVLKIDGESYSLQQARVYLANYKNLYGKAEGADLWKQGNEDGSLEQYVKDLALFQMAKILSMDSLAKNRGIELDETEETGVQKAAKSYYRSLSGPELSFLDVDESDLEKLYEDYALAQKLYKSLTEDINSEVSDDEARIMDAMQIVVSDKKTAQTVRKALKDGEDFATVAGSYNEAEETKIQFGRGELPGEVEKTAFAMDNGTASECIKTAEGYYFIYCTNKFNQELTDIHKLKIVQQREKTAFGDVYDAYTKTISKKIYEKVWDDAAAGLSDEIVTDQFFEFYQENCSSQN